MKQAGALRSTWWALDTAHTPFSAWPTCSAHQSLASARRPAPPWLHSAMLPFPEVFPVLLTWQNACHCGTGWPSKPSLIDPSLQYRARGCRGLASVPLLDTAHVCLVLSPRTGQLLEVGPPYLRLQGWKQLTVSDSCGGLEWPVPWNWFYPQVGSGWDQLSSAQAWQPPVQRAPIFSSTGAP